MLSDLPPAFVETEQLRVELLAVDQSLKPGSRQWLALRLTHAPEWHTYWTNPGDSGLATKTRWDLPAGISIGGIQWPAPQRHALGELINFGYDQTVLLPIEMQSSAGLGGSRVRIGVNVSWLVCREECIPGRAQLGLELPVSPAEPQPGPAAAEIAEVRRLLPQPRDWPLRLETEGSGFRLSVEDAGTLPADGLELFPVQAQVLSNSAAAGHRTGSTLVFSAARSDYFTALPQEFSVVLVDPATRQSYLVQSRTVLSTP